jgi:hypothetical protein
MIYIKPAEKSQMNNNSLRESPIGQDWSNPTSPFPALKLKPPFKYKECTQPLIF